MVSLWPLPAKLAELGEIAAARHPQLAPRIERAVAIAIGRDWAYWGDDLWDIRGYLVTTHSCTCPDVENSAPLFHGRRICKHQLTVILLNRAYADLEMEIPAKILRGNYPPVTEASMALVRARLGMAKAGLMLI